MKVLTNFLAIYLAFFLVVWADTVGPIPDPFHEYYFPQILDHFREGNLSNIRFNQRYFLDQTNWAGQKSRAPMLVYLGGESPITYIVREIGIMEEAANKFQALILYIEHRYYGKSVPFENIDIAMSDKEIRGCLTSEQALVDFAEIIQTIKKTFLDKNSPIIVFGCSYSGMLAAWFRLKFPHLATGAVASSAPIFYFDLDQAWENDFCEVVSNDYKIVSEKCYERIRQSWDLIDNIALQRAIGHANLDKLFKTCSPILSVETLKSSLVTFFAYNAQYNGRYNGLINEVCNEIVRAPDDDILGGIARSAIGGSPCFNIYKFLNVNTTRGSIDSNASKAWNWQTCSEFIIRQGCGNHTMFQPRPFNLTKTVDSCTSTYHVAPRLNWVSTYYGGYDMRSTFRRFGSNIVFTNGLMDPYSPFGVLKDLSQTVVAITTKKGSHCLDFQIPLKDDPKWLKQQRAKEFRRIARWTNINSQSSYNPQTWFMWSGFVLTFALLY